jgi:hypothetical protein
MAAIDGGTSGLRLLMWVLLVLVFITIGVVCTWTRAGGEFVPPVVGLADVDRDSTIRSDADEVGTAGNRTLRSEAELSPARVLVLGAEGQVVPGANVAVGHHAGPAWRVAATGLTAHDGTWDAGASLGGLDLRGLDLAVWAPGHGHWFGAGAMPAVGERVVVHLPPTVEVRGRVRARDGSTVPHLELHTISRGHGNWIVGGFASDCWFPDEYSWAAPPESAVFHQLVRTEADGSFVARGIAPNWHTTITLLDNAWVLVPAALQVEPGVGEVDLVVDRASGVEIDAREIVGPGATVHVTATGSGSVRSFAVQATRGRAVVRFVAPADWTEIRYHAAAVGGSADASSDVVTVPRHAMARLVLRASAADDAATDDSVRARILRLIVQWPDGTLCTEGILLAAEDPSGRPVGCEVVEHQGGRYVIRCDPATAMLGVLARDCWRDLSTAPVLKVRETSADQWLSVTMPSGADVLLLTPGLAPTWVMVEGGFGARMVQVEGSTTLRAVERGTLTASCTVQGSRRRAVTEVGAGGMAVLDLTR